MRITLTSHSDILQYNQCSQAILSSSQGVWEGGLTEVILKPVKGSQTSKQPYLTTVLYPGTLLASGILRKEQRLRSLGFYSSSTQVPPSSGPQFLNCEIQQLK